MKSPGRRAADGHVTTNPGAESHSCLRLRIHNAEVTTLQANWPLVQCYLRGEEQVPVTCVKHLLEFL